MNTPEFREDCAQRLTESANRVAALKAFVGLDGFVDEIVHVVDKRQSAESFQRLATISQFAERLAGAANQSTNVELVTKLTKLGGNGPIMANALASFGIKVSYLGNLGYPNLHPIFADFAKRAEIFSIAEPGHTDAVEFEDGKIMLGKHSSLKDVNWQNIESRFGRDKFSDKFSSSDLVGFVNWTMLPYMNGVWETALKEICPAMNGSRKIIFFDLADPEKRTADDIRHALELIASFQKYFDVILGVNEKEATEVGKVLGLDTSNRSSEGLSKLALAINEKCPVKTVVVHPVTYALAASDGKVDIVEGPFCGKPLITTGAGDHFNSGFCLGKMLGFDNAMSLLVGVATSGFYVRSMKSPSIADLSAMMRSWPS